MMTSQVADIKKHEGMWKAIHDLEEATKTRVNINSTRPLVEAFDTKLEDIRMEVATQKAQIEEISASKREEPQENSTSPLKQASLEDIGEIGAKEFDTTFRKIFTAKERKSHHLDTENEYVGPFRKDIEAALNRITRSVMRKIKKYPVCENMSLDWVIRRLSATCSDKRSCVKKYRYFLSSLMAKCSKLSE